ncbi:MAG: hypothetical protein EU547_07455 [Promethearchaeota archaeon]|nr:MAG: hypothetical protein EU547_07455 [Candidatus Lokiarchaeota archaeon]
MFNVLSISDWTGPIKYDFESDTIGENPVGEKLTIYEPAGCGYVEVNNVAGHKCTVITKTGGVDRVYLRDDIGDANYTAGEIHFWAYHDSSGFGVNLISAHNEMLIDMVWWGGDIIRDGPYGTDIADYAYDTWIEVVIYFDLDQGWMFDLDDTRYGDGYVYPFSGSFTANASHILWSSFWSGGGAGDFCVDDIGYDNLVEEPQEIDLIPPIIYCANSELTIEQYSIRSIEWNITDNSGGTYCIYKNDTEIFTGDFYSGLNILPPTIIDSSIIRDLNYTIIAEDNSNNIALNTLIIHVVADSGSENDHGGGGGSKKDGENTIPFDNYYLIISIITLVLIIIFIKPKLKMLKK